MAMEIATQARAPIRSPEGQHERADNNALEAENDKIRCENIAIREALKHAICTNCGGPPISEDPYFNEHKLWIENAHLRDEPNNLATTSDMDKS
ncbi:hypothetical protein Bca52824_033497 [Brassica carinata]|uniref:Uncharacterized protein n=1 Tax=Brassica carinata TaxID=52824 RepID=A0A8X7V8K0_BRACI|nr:hypothetical protein Bca52824_033497 [Brassica carinata]